MFLMFLLCFMLNIDFVCVLFLKHVILYCIVYVLCLLCLVVFNKYLGCMIVWFSVCALLIL